jgi:hypothetical protein
MSHALSAARRVADYIRALERQIRDLKAENKQLRAALAATKEPRP